MKMFQVFVPYFKEMPNRARTGEHVAASREEQGPAVVPLPEVGQHRGH